MHSKCYHAVNRRPWSYFYRLSFPNRNSDSGVPYIVFKRFHLIFPVAHLDFQVEARFMHSLANHAYALQYRISHIIPCSCVGCLLCCVLLSGVCFFELVPVTSRCEDPFVYARLSSSWTCSSSLRDFRQDEHTLEITSIFACLVARSFATPMLRYLPLAYHASHIVKSSL